MKRDVLLSVENLSVSFGDSKAVESLSFDVERGETVALVGESGSGKTVSALSILKLLPYPQAHHPQGKILFQDRDILTLPKSKIEELRGGKIAMIFQEPMTSLNPVHTIEKQISEALFLHKGLTGRQARERCAELLEMVGFDNISDRLKAYPHQLSGGQRQRVMIAMAIAGDPDLLIADEPTTALDVTTQAQILALLQDLRKKLGMSLLLITHDLGIVKHSADRVYVMAKGRLRESGRVKTVFQSPKDSYTKQLLAAEPNGQPADIEASAKTVLNAKDLAVSFTIDRGLFTKKDEFKAVDRVSLAIKEGETLGVVGESGSGKTTLAMALLRLQESKGVINLMGHELQDLSNRALRPYRRKIQVVFQDPFGSLSPRMSVAEIIAEGIKLHGMAKKTDDIDKLVVNILREVGLNPDVRHRYPHEFSGGQRQRIAVARALVLKPKVLILDEPTSALDRAVQLEVIDLLRNLQKRYKLSYIFISHDLSVVRAMSHRIYVMYKGKVVEEGEAKSLFAAPQHSYTKKLLSAALDL